MSIAFGLRGGSKDVRLSVAPTVNIMLPRMLQRRNAVSSESSRPGTFDDDQFVIQSYPKSQMQRARIQEILSGIVLFQGVSDSIMKDLVGGFFEMKYNDGDKIIVQGDMIAERFFLLESGQCDIFIKKGSADPIKVHTVLPGGFFGELALLYNAPRAATVQSVGESKLWALDRGTFKNCMARASKAEAQGNIGSESSLLKIVPKSSQLPTPTQQRGAFALIDEQVMKALDQQGKDSVKVQGIPEWNTIVEMSINGDKFFQRLLKFSHPNVHIYKLSHMDATSQSMVHLDVTDPRHSIFLPLCKILPTGSPNTVLLEGHHLDGTISFKFANSRDQSHFISMAGKSSDMYAMVNDAYQDVRYLSAGGKVQDSRSPDDIVPNICGVGLFIDYSKNGKSITVREIMPGSPAATSGLIHVHDHLLKIDRVSVKHSFETLEDVVQAIRGIEGSKVCLQFRKCSGPEAKNIFEVTLKRGLNVTVQNSSMSQSAGTHSDSKVFVDNHEHSILQNEQDAEIVGNSTDVRSGLEMQRSSYSGVLASQNNSQFEAFGTIKTPHHRFPSPYEHREQEPFFADGSVTFSRDPSITLDSDEKLSGYLQALSSTSIGTGSTNMFQRPNFQGFATDLGIMLVPTRDHRYTVLSIIPKSRSSQRNIMIGDVLLAINHEPVDLKSPEEVCDQLCDPNSEVFLSFSRNGIIAHVVIPKPLYQPANQILVGHAMAPNQLSPQFHDDRKFKVSTSSTHIFENISDDRLISSGFSVNKSMLGSFVVTSVTSCDIRRLEIDDVISAIDGHVLSRRDTLDDVEHLLKEPIGTVARLALVKQSGGAGGVMRKSVQVLRMQGLPRGERNSLPFHSHDAGAFSKSLELQKIVDAQSKRKLNRLPNSADFYDSDESCLSEYTESRASVVSSLSEHQGSSHHRAGVGITFLEVKTLNKTGFVVDNILLQSPAHQCGKIDVGDKLIKIDGRRLYLDQSLESLTRRIEGVVGSQVTLDLIKSDSGVTYSITLRRSLNLNSQNEFTPPLLRLPFQASLQSTTRSLIDSPNYPSSQPALPSKNASPVFLEPAHSHESSTTPSIVDSFERKASTFARIRSERHASIDYNGAFRKKDSAKHTLAHASKSFSFRDMFFPSTIRAATGKD